MSLSQTQIQAARRKSPFVDRVCEVDGCQELGIPQRSKLGKLFRWKRCSLHNARAVSERIGATLLSETRRVNRDGYVDVWVNGQWKPEHRVAMERILGRPMASGESVHHINGIRDDNQDDNLELWVGAIRYGQRARDIKCPCCGCSYEVAAMRRPVDHGE